MPTEAQRAASRSNGRKSRGPSTPAGKNRSSRNAVHRPNPGLARSAVLEGEDAALLHHLLADLQKHFRPSTVVEDALIESMLMARCRQMRLWAMEKEGLEQEIRPSTPTRRIARPGPCRDSFFLRKRTWEV